MTVAGQGQVPVGQLLGQQPRRPSTLSALTRWRDWRISVKLGAVTLVPILFAMALGGITIVNQVDRSNNYERINRLVTLGADVRALTGALQEERTQTAALLTQGTVGSSPALDSARGAVDQAIPRFNVDAARAGELDSSITDPDIAVRNSLAQLADLRQRATSGQVEVVEALDDYTDMTGALLGMDNALVAKIGDGSIGTSPTALHGLQVAKEDISTSQALLGYGISRGNLTVAQLNELRRLEVQLADRLDDFNSAASREQQQDFERSVMGPDFDSRTRLVNSVLQAQNPAQALGALSAQQWDSASSSVIAAVDGVSGRLGSQLSASSAGLVENSGTDAGLLAVLLFLALVVTGAVVFLITRQLLRTLRRLRAGAMDIADHQLPAAVRNIQDGVEQSAEVAPLAIGTTDEIGEVAKAFDAVHSQALRLAIEQANLRTGYSSVFVNLSRRSQSLVQRQLQLIERLERDEEDADQLATLFQLDHLATRMRRNNENLMVLSGAEPGRRSGQPVATADVLRAAVSEIEQYQRVVVEQPPTARIVGYAASDLMRLTAELLDNATAFSAPETKVTVTTRIAEGGLMVDIVDKGIGMTETEIAEANSRLATDTDVDLATSRRMGLFVVGRLAGRHKIRVTLHGGKDTVGVRVTVAVPGELVMDLQETGQIHPAPLTAEPSAAPTGSGDALPRRRTVNGAGRPGGLSNIAGVSGTLSDGAAAPGGWTNGHSGVLPARTSGDVEISGTALFSPPQPSEHPSLPSMPPVPPPAAANPELPPVAEPPATPPVPPRNSSSNPLPSGKALFESNNNAGPTSEWWAPTAPEPEPEPDLPETTPIFDETLSAWFRSDKPAPRRQPSSASSRPPATTPEPAQPAEPVTPPAEPALSSPPVDQVLESEPQPSEAYEPEVARSAPAPAETERADWAFAADERWRAVQSVSEVEPTSYTEAGLPRRRRGEKLLPGTAASEPVRQPKRPVRDPADIRGRLSSFQQGVNRARHAAATAPSGETASAPQPASGPGQSSQPLPTWSQQPSGTPGLPGQLPQRRPRLTSSHEDDQSVPASDSGQLPLREPMSAESTAYTPVERGTLPHYDEYESESSGTLSWPESPEQGLAEEETGVPQRGSLEPAEPAGSTASAGQQSTWSFPADDSWRTVEAVSKSAPSSFTAAGLPRRRRGEQLLPGAANSGPGGGTRPQQQRDPQDVRGRLSSFQQGVQRGRHRTAQAVDSERETMEGE